MKNDKSDKQTLEENIRFIKKIMNDTKRVELKNGPILILWGIIVTMAQATTYFLLRSEYQYLIWPMWGIAALGGIAGTVFLARGIKTLNTFSERVLSRTWLAFGMSALIFIFLSPEGKTGISDHGTGINPVLCLLLGMGYSITGTIYDKGWLKYVSFGWWAGALLMYLWPGDHAYLLFAIFMLLFQVIPGIKIQHDYRKELSDGGER